MNSRNTPPVTPFPRVILSGIAVCAAILLAATPSALCLNIFRDFNPDVNNRYDASTFTVVSTVGPLIPDLNPSPLFLGAGYDFSSASYNRQGSLDAFAGGFILLSPRHITTATHASTGFVSFLTGDGGVSGSTTAGTATGTGYGYPFATRDLAIQRLTAEIDTDNGIRWAPVLDLAVKNGTSTSYAGWQGQQILVLGRNLVPWTTPLVASATIDAPTVSDNLTTPSQSWSYYRISQAAAGFDFIGGDSGAGSYIPWTDPLGNKLLTAVGTHSAVSGSRTGWNWDNFLAADGAILSMNNIMRPTGYAIQMVGDASQFWVGGNGSTFDNSASWTGGSSSAITPDDFSYVGFRAAEAQSQTVTVDSGSQARGLVFHPGSGAGAAFTLTGGSLALGRGGIVNYSTETQTIATPTSLAHSQWWIANKGNLNITGNVGLNDQLLIIDTIGANRTVTVSASIGSSILGTRKVVLSKEGTGTLILSAANAFNNNNVIINGGTLLSNHSSAFSGAHQVIVERGGTLLTGAGVSAQLNELFVRAGGTIGGLGVYRVNVSVGNADSTSLNTDAKVSPGIGGIGELGGFGFFLGAAGRYEWEINDFYGVAGGGSNGRGWDMIRALVPHSPQSMGTLNLNNITLDRPFVLDLVTLNLQGEAGGLPPFWEAGVTYTWTIAQAQNGIVGFSAGKFSFDTSRFGVQGSFAVTTSGNNLNLEFTPVPEPGAFSLLLIGAILFGWRRYRSRTV